MTGSATLLERDSLKWLVDCGMFQGGEELEKRNRKTQPYQAPKLSFILLTHAHIDHSGLIPKWSGKDSGARSFAPRRPLISVK